MTGVGSRNLTVKCLFESRSRSVERRLMAERHGKGGLTGSDLEVEHEQRVDEVAVVWLVVVRSRVALATGIGSLAGGDYKVEVKRRRWMWME
ncbi:unnamed protein product [Citrullus colocynthis]|uniref:Uncharacterized protein n=1 Tax=Citrullus colocynthis TaxID=252529 RepID=A0ABP0XUV5_9ROSI